jgi:hypothetical protein
VAIMRGLMFVISASFLFTALLFTGSGNIRSVRADSSVYQGDLILTGSNVYTIEGRFDMNGSIIVEDNATLVLKDAFVNFTETRDNQFNMTLSFSAGGKPSFIVENSTVTANSHDIFFVFFGNSSASINGLTDSENVTMDFADNSVASISDSTLKQVSSSGYSYINLSQSSVSAGVWSYDHSQVTISACTLPQITAALASNVTVANSTVTEDVVFDCHDVNCSISRLEPGFVQDWNLRENCTVETASGNAPNLALSDTQVAGWSPQFEDYSNVSVSDSRLWGLSVSNHTDIRVYNCLFDGTVWAFTSVAYLSDSYVAGQANAGDYSQFWFVNSSVGQISVIAIGAQIFTLWHLRVHVTDLNGNYVPGASVAAFYSNSTLAMSGQTDANGTVTLDLIEDTSTASSEYTMGNYTIEAEYQTYSNSTIVSMTGNEETNFTMGFVVPEFQPFLFLSLFLITTLLTVAVHKRKHSESLGI